MAGKRGAWLLVLSLCGCHAPAAIDLPLSVERALSEAQQQPFVARRERATQAQPVRRHRHATWLDQRVQMHYTELPATQAIRALLASRPSYFSADINSDPMVTAPPGNSLHIREHLEAIATQTNWAYEINDRGHVFWTSLPTQIFQLAVPEQSRSSQLGAQPTGDSSADGATAGLQLQHHVEPYAELQKSLDGLLGDHHYAMLPSVNSVLVTAPPDVLSQVERLIKRFNRVAQQRVLVALELYLVDLTDSGQNSVDWSLLYQRTERYRLGISAAGSGSLDASAPFQLSLGDLSGGRFSGSDLILKALSEQGATSLVSRPRIICLNNQVSELRLNRVSPYVESVLLTEQTRGDTTQVTPEVKTAEVVGGTTLYLLPTVVGDQINLLVSVNYTQVNRFLAQTLGAAGSSVSLRLPEYDDTQFTLPIVLGSGETVVLAGNPRTLSSRRSLRNPLLPIQRDASHSRRQLETVLLVTAHLLDPMPELR